MADLSHHAGDITAHPDIHEMRERYARMVGGPSVAIVDGLMLLTGLYAAISPWTVHFAALRPQLTVNNLVLGIAIAVLGIGLTVAPVRMLGLSWAMTAIGVWMIISPWVVTRGPDAGMICNNVVIGAVTCCLGLAAASLELRRGQTMRTP